MATATVHIDDVPGFLGRARCYQLDPPPVIEGISSPFVTLVLQPRIGRQPPEVRAYPALSTGASAVPQLVRGPGSYRPHEPVDIEGAFWFALLMLGGYTIAGPDLAKGAS
ncbi:hypothetical protein [Nocardia cyriacigeorgica]|uniref:hypothetical protein n=1 Tax=Nocardia cyriacigeorgica TaxID=135487 RepID=UPI0024582E30|nr:hypothetical protein [Nocardia cyriacigeorgica]